MGDSRVAQSRRWRVLWVHHKAEERRVHDRATIPEMTARHVIGNLLASRQVARMNAGWVAANAAACWGKECKRRGAYLAIFVMSAVSSFRSQDEPGPPGAIVGASVGAAVGNVGHLSHDQHGFQFTSPAKAVRRAQDFQS